MSLRCEEARRLGARESAGEITAREFDALDRHREICPGCAARARTGDPLSLFAALRERAADPAVGEAIRANVRAGVLAGRGSEAAWDGPRRLRPAYRVAAAAALVVGLGVLALTGPAPEAIPEAAVHAVPAAGPAVATVESIGSPSARVYDMQVIAEDGEVTELVLIFDEEIDL